MKIAFNILKSKIFQLIIAVVLLTVIVLKYNISIENIFTKVIHFQYLAVALAVVLFIKPFISNSRWLIFLKYFGINESIFHLIKISWVSVFYGLFVPIGSASDAFKMFFIEKKYPEKRGDPGASVLADRMTGLILFSLVASVGCLFLPSGDELSKIKTVVFLSFLVVIIITIAVVNDKIYNLITPLLEKIKFLQFIFRYLSKLHKSLTVLPYKKIIPKVSPFILAFQIINILLAHLVFLAVGVDIPFYYHLVFIPIIQVISMLPVSISGLGFREGVFIYFYKMLNIPAEVSFSVSIIYFLVMMVVPAIIGGVLILADKLKFTRLSVIKE